MILQEVECNLHPFMHKNLPQHDLKDGPHGEETAGNGIKP